MNVKTKLWAAGAVVAILFLSGGRYSLIANAQDQPLPPAGNYRVDVEPAWAPGAVRPGHPVAATGVVEQGSGGTGLRLEARRGVVLPSGERVRIRFIAPA